ncbi:MAG: HlyD family type I secretion periplasmic adaptor subunit [Gallionella sp.]|jgi:HlyD family secretion protein|nr:HlyD family type I secretion periplasmic adaptor subunit [Gallionella sp.]
MESTDKSSITPAVGKKRADDAVAIEFLPDADEIERRPYPKAARITLHLLLTVVVVFLLWASLSEIDLVVSARGKLVTPLPNIVVQPMDTAIIQSINVRVGQVVKKGEVLAMLDPTFAQADESELRTRLQSLDTQSRRLEAEMAGRRLADKPDAGGDAELQARLSVEREASYRAQLRGMDEAIARLRASLNTNELDQQVLGARVRDLREIESMQERLVAQKFAAPLRLLEAREKRLEIEREQQLAQSREQEFKLELAGAESEKTAFVKGWRQRTMEDLLSTSRDRDALNEQLQKADKRHRLVTLVSPADAVVLEIAKLSQGSVVKGAEPLFTLVPLGAELEAEVQIDSIDVGYIRLGDVAKLKFDAFPFQRHGSLDGELRTVSEDAFRRDTAAGQGADAYYLSRISMGKERLKKLPDQARLLPGMTLTAEIKVGSRSVISYLLWPLTKTLDESIREP